MIRQRPLPAARMAATVAFAAMFGAAAAVATAALPAVSAPPAAAVAVPGPAGGPAAAAPARPDGAAAAPIPPPASPVAPRLARALADPAARPRDAAGRLPVWVFFVDRGLDGPALAAALQRAEDELSPRARLRRQRGRLPDGRLVAPGDLPLAGDYLRQARATGALLRRQSRWLNAASFDATPEQVARLAVLPCVRKLDLVAKLRRAPLPEPEWTPLPQAAPKAAPGAAPGAGPGAAPRAGRPDKGSLGGGGPGPAAAAIDSASYGPSLGALAQINVLPVHEEGYTGEGMLIGMLDTGFKTTHEALAHIPVLARWDFINDDPVVENEAGDAVNQHNHGTFTLSALAGYSAGELVGPAHGATFVLAKTEDVTSEVPVEEDYWVAGLEWLDTFGVDVVSSSLGYFDWYEFADLDGNTAVTTVAADLAAARGLVVVTAAGNERATAWGHLIAPADADSAITVGAVRLDGTVTAFSSPGPTADGRTKPDVCALGAGVPVASPSDDTAYGAVSGTSLSTPLAAGVAALVLQRGPLLTPMQVREALTATASRAAAPDNDFGWGILDAHAAVHWFGPVFAHAALPDTVPQAAAHRVACRLTDRAPLDPAALALRWRAGGGPWLELPLTPSGPDSFAADLPGQPTGTVVEYYLTAADSAGIAAAEPPAGAAAPHAFLVLGASTGVDDANRPGGRADGGAGEPGGLPDGWGGLPARTALGAPLPNPFNPRVELPYDLARPGSARLAIFDVRGRLVRELAAAELPAGRYRAVWDGTDAAGRAVPSGAYVARLVTENARSERRLTLVR